MPVHSHTHDCVTGRHTQASQRVSGTTLGLVGVEEALNQTGIAVRMTYVSKEKLVKDMQFRGAISDFHPIKEQIMKSDYDPLLLRTNEDDLYGDGNNFEVWLCSLMITLDQALL